MKTMKLLLPFITALLVSPSLFAQPLMESFRDPQWSTYIFVSTKMPRSSLVDLAREATKAQALLVFNGFDDKYQNTASMQKLTSEINEACCGKNAAHWLIHPKLFERYNVKVAPAFVIAHGTGNKPGDYSLVVGDMALANALKFFVQDSKIESIRNHAGDVYRSAFLHK